MILDYLLTRFLPFFSLLLFVVAASVGAFTGGIWAALGIGGAVVMTAMTCRIERYLPPPDPGLTLLTLAALLVMALLNLGSSTPALSWHVLGQLVTIFVPLLFLSNVQTQSYGFSPRQLDLIFVAAVAGAMGLGIELSLGGPLLNAVKKGHAALTEYNRGLSYLVILAFPIMAGLRLRGRKILIAILILALLFPAGLTESRSAKLALLAGLMVAGAAYLAPVVTRRILVVLPVALLAWPFAVQKFFVAHYEMLRHFPASWRARMEIWDYMSYRIMEHPILGWGLGASRDLPVQNPHGYLYLMTVDPAPHPHNVVTQLWVELGVPGLMLGLGFAWITLFKAVRFDERIAPFAMGAWVAGLSLSLVAYNFWTDSLFAAFALTGFLFSTLNAKQASE